MSTPNARFIARAYIDNQKVDMTDHWVVLQSTTPGNCQITVKTEAKNLPLYQLIWAGAT
jgi:hypothetical protein